jgi:hypothetical protein
MLFRLVHHLLLTLADFDDQPARADMRAISDFLRFDRFFARAVPPFDPAASAPRRSISVRNSRITRWRSFLWSRSLLSHGVQ